MDNATGSWRVLWRGKYVILAGLILGVAAAVVATNASKKVYEASAIVQVEPQVPSVASDVLGLQQASQGLATTYATLVGLQSFLARIQPRVENGKYTAADLASLVSAEAITPSGQNTNLIRLSARAGDAREAKLLASSVAAVFVTTVESDSARRAAQQGKQLQVRISGLTAQINKLTSETSPSGLPSIQGELASLRATLTSLTTQLARAIAAEVEQSGSLSLVAPATAPRSPISPRPLLNLAIGISLGLMVGIALAWLRNLLDRYLHNSEEIQELVELPVLASIPLRRSATADDPVTREAYDVLRTNLTFLSLDQQLAVVTVTSTEEGEGKTAVAEGLARAAMRHGMRVLLVDGDLRKSALSSRLGVSRADGLSRLMISALRRRGDRTVDAAMLKSAIQELTPGLYLLPAGPAPPNPPSVLASAKMGELVATMRSNFDLVVFDSPPVAQMADASILAALADGSIVVVRAGRTLRTQLVAVVKALQRTPTPVIGAVLFERRSVDSVYYRSEEVSTPLLP